MAIRESGVMPRGHEVMPRNLSTCASAAMTIKAIKAVMMPRWICEWVKIILLLSYRLAVT